MSPSVHNIFDSNALKVGRHGSFKWKGVGKKSIQLLAVPKSMEHDTIEDPAETLPQLLSGLWHLIVEGCSLTRGVSASVYRTNEFQNSPIR